MRGCVSFRLFAFGCPNRIETKRRFSWPGFHVFVRLCNLLLFLTLTPNAAMLSVHMAKAKVVTYAVKKHTHTRTPAHNIPESFVSVHTNRHTYTLAGRRQSVRTRLAGAIASLHHENQTVCVTRLSSSVPIFPIRGARTRTATNTSACPGQ